MAKQENKFDAAAKTWDSQPQGIQNAEKFATIIKNAIQNKNYKKAAEYGCGTGNVSLRIHDKFEEITLFDSSVKMLEEAEKKAVESGISHFKFIHVNDDPIKISEKFDVIYSLMTLHHVKNVEQLIADFRKMLKPGGILFIGDLEKEDGNFHPYPDNQDVHHGFEKDYLEKILANHNFKIESYSVFQKMERTHTGKSVIYPLFALLAS